MLKSLLLDLLPLPHWNHLPNLILRNVNFPQRHFCLLSKFSFGQWNNSSNTSSNNNNNIPGKAMMMIMMNVVCMLGPPIVLWKVLPNFFWIYLITFIKDFCILHHVPFSSVKERTSKSDVNVKENKIKTCIIKMMMLVALIA